MSTSCAIVDQWGLPLASTQKFARASETCTYDRPVMPTRLDDITKLITPYDRRVLVAVSRLMAENWGPMRAICRQIPMFSVGNAWIPSNQSTGTRFATRAETIIREEVLPIADLRGRPWGKLVYDFTQEFSARDGESFILKTSHENGFPAFQILPSHRIGSRYNWHGYGASQPVLKSGRFSGAKIIDGIILNRLNQVIGYYFMGDTEKEDEQIPAKYVEHVFDSDYSEGVRGYPATTHGLNDARDSLQSHEWERFNLLFRSAHTIIEDSIAGAPDDSPGQHFGGKQSDGTTTPGMRVNALMGGLIRHMQAGSGAKLQSLKHETPGEIYESYTDRMIKALCTGVPWPFSFVWQATGQGTAERRDIEQARRTIADVQGTIEPVCRRLIGYATAVLQKKGRIPQSPDWWRWTFNKPAKLTIDDGRVSKAALEMHARGVISDEDLLDDQGKDHDEYWTRKFAAAARKEQLFAEAEKAFGVKIDPRVKGMFTPNDKAEPEEETTPTKEEK